MVKTTVAVVLPISGIGATVNNCPLPWTNAWQLFGLPHRPDLVRVAGHPQPDHQHHPGQYRIPHRAGPHRTRPRVHLPLPRLRRASRALRPRPPIPHPDGDTTADNLHCLCRRHHRIKRKPAGVVNIGDNELEWTSPAGRTYRTKPPNTLDHAA